MNEQTPHNAEKAQPYLHPDDGHTLDCTRLHDGWLCAPECPNSPAGEDR